MRLTDKPGSISSQGTDAGTIIGHQAEPIWARSLPQNVLARVPIPDLERAFYSLGDRAKAGTWKRRR